jgi:hypothetical protein
MKDQNLKMMNVHASHTLGLIEELEYLEIETRLIDEKFVIIFFSSDLAGRISISELAVHGKISSPCKTFINPRR